MSPLASVSILDFPQEILQQIVLCAVLDCPLGRPPKELCACLLTCRAFYDTLSPKNTSGLYYSIFLQQFDGAGPVYRLSESAVREHAALELRRRFRAIQVFKSRSIYHPELTDALWIAYLMVEDSDTSQKNIKQLLRAQLPSFLDRYLRDRLYEHAGQNEGMPVITEQNSLAIALSWLLASNRVLSYEAREVRLETMRRLIPIVFAADRYSIFHTEEGLFTFSGTAPTTTTVSTSPLSPVQRNYEPSLQSPSIIPPCHIFYFGAVKRRVRPPCAAIFATLLFLVRKHAPIPIPSHITYATREEATAAGYFGPTVEDIRHFNERCGTRFADFPGIDVGVHSSALATSPDTILGQPSLYHVGRLTGQWQGSSMIADNGNVPLCARTVSSCIAYPLYITLEEHFCYEEASAVPYTPLEKGAANAWLPPNVHSVPTEKGMRFYDAKGTFDTTYETYRPGKTKLHSGERVADVIITGKTEERYLAAWYAPPRIIGRVRLYDGLMVLVRYWPAGEDVAQVMCGYVTSSRNLVGRFESLSEYMGLRSVFSLGLNNAQNLARASQMGMMS